MSTTVDNRARAELLRSRCAAHFDLHSRLAPARSYWLGKVCRDLAPTLTGDVQSSHPLAIFPTPGRWPPGIISATPRK